ncbi:unnamed protein product [Adineta ricciae]|uniref:Uncharacterized protein n=1 Tax=Adineta ricciae TaxID=249248 RepID=A0A815W5K3_ADIRI|nr:unnamed protein product [Adineta ricciae]
MNTSNSQHSVADLLPYGISDRMATILTKQHVSDEDLQIMDRDDVEHLFKNEYGFTFRDRKQFWNIIQKIQISQNTNRKTEEIAHSPESLEHVYGFTEEEEKEESTDSKQHQLSHSNHLFENKVTSNIDDDDDDDDKHSNSSSHLSISSGYIFTYPSILPSFSSNITHALQTNTIHKQWAAFINELARWVMAIKPCLREQHEYRAIGQTLYEKYPNIGTAGPKPWSFLCRSLSQRIRTERWQRRKALTMKNRKEKQRKTLDRNNHMTEFEILI